VVHVTPPWASSWLAATAGANSPLHAKYRVYLQIVTVATGPYNYTDRLTEVFAKQFEHLRMWVLDPYDLALSKLQRNLEVDFEDVKHLARSCMLDLKELESRYREELRSYLTGPLERHDQTLRSWLDAIREERGGC
jgi:hypothetical protein